MNKGSHATIVLFCILVILSAPLSAAGIEIGLAWVGESGMAKRVNSGFSQGLQELAPEISVEEKKELATLDDLATLVSTWEKEKDGMVLLRSNAAKWLGQHPPAIPTFIGACNHPGQLGAVKNLDAPEGNITGVTYFLPKESQFEIIRTIIPDLNSVLLLVEKGHPSSAIDQEGTRRVCGKLGLNYTEAVCSSVEEAVKAAEDHKGKVSCIIIGNQSLIIDNAGKIIEAAGQTPVLSYSSKPAKVGALGGFVAEDTKLGYMLAQTVVDVLKKGKSIKDMPVKVDPDPKFYLNAATAERLGIEIPFTILEAATIVE